MGSGESTREEVGCGRNEDVETYEWSHQAGTIRNERIGWTSKVGAISKKVQESRLKWCVHVLRREEEYVGKRVMVMEVSVKRRRGRSERRWLDDINDDLPERELPGDEAKDRVKWTASHGKHRPHIKVRKDAEEEENYGDDCILYIATAKPGEVRTSERHNSCHSLMCYIENVIIFYEFCNIICHRKCREDECVNTLTCYVAYNFIRSVHLLV